MENRTVPITSLAFSPDGNYLVSGEWDRKIMLTSAPFSELKLEVSFEVTHMDVARSMLELAEVTENDVVYDLRCGDERIVIMAVKEFGARGFEVDIDPLRVEQSIENAEKAGVSGRVKFKLEDFKYTGLTKSTVVMLYVGSRLNCVARLNIFCDMEPGSRIVSHADDMEVEQNDVPSQSTQ